HRDLKPSNVMVSRDGFVKIVDFGLAKLVDPDAELDDTTAPAISRPGQLLGTVDYMSPEQARGEALDFRSDQFSLGVVLYEMASGISPFRRASTAETLSAILKDDPPALSGLRPELPAPLRWVIERCLAKDPEDRFGCTHDLASVLTAIRDLTQ